MEFKSLQPRIIHLKENFFHNSDAENDFTHQRESFMQIGGYSDYSVHRNFRLLKAAIFEGLSTSISGFYCLFSKLFVFPNFFRNSSCKMLASIYYSKQRLEY